MNIKKLRQVYIATEDIERQASFYENVLGLALQFRDGNRWIQFKTGDVSIALASPEESLGAPLDVPVPVFEIDDLDVAVAELRAQGREVETTRDMGAHGRLAMIRDPSGAFLVLFQKSTGA